MNNKNPLVKNDCSKRRKHTLLDALGADPGDLLVPVQLGSLFTRNTILLRSRGLETVVEETVRLVDLAESLVHAARRGEVAGEEVDQCRRAGPGEP
jgi:hypothetical protein